MIQARQSIFFLLSAMLTVSIWYACGKKESPKTDVNPNGSSPLAMMMRDMLETGQKIRSEIMAGKVPSAMPVAYHDMTKTQPTEGMIDNPAVFEGFSKHFLATWDSLYTPGVNTTQAFNAIVNSCINCHKSYCQGPIPAISKLKLPEN